MKNLRIIVFFLMLLVTQSCLSQKRMVFGLEEGYRKLIDTSFTNEWGYVGPEGLADKLCIDLKNKTIKFYKKSFDTQIMSVTDVTRDTTKKISEDKFIKFLCLNKYNHVNTFLLYKDSIPNVYTAIIYTKEECFKYKLLKK